MAIIASSFNDKDERKTSIMTRVIVVVAIVRAVVARVVLQMRITCLGFLGFL